MLLGFIDSCVNWCNYWIICALTMWVANLEYPWAELWGVQCLHDFTDAWDMIVCTVCPVRVVSYLCGLLWNHSWNQCTHFHSSVWIPYPTVIRKWILHVSLLHLLCVSKCTQCTLHCYIGFSIFIPLCRGILNMIAIQFQEKGLNNSSILFKCISW